MRLSWWGEADTRAGTDGTADEGGSRAVVIRKDDDKCTCWTDVEDCNTASKDDATMSCDHPHELLGDWSMLMSLCSFRLMRSLYLWRSWVRWMR